MFETAEDVGAGALKVGDRPARVDPLLGGMLWGWACKVEGVDKVDAMKRGWADCR